MAEKVGINGHPCLGAVGANTLKNKVNIKLLKCSPVNIGKAHKVDKIRLGESGSFSSNFSCNARMAFNCSPISKRTACYAALIVTHKLK